MAGHHKWADIHHKRTEHAMSWSLTWSGPAQEATRYKGLAKQLEGLARTRTAQEHGDAAHAIDLMERVVRQGLTFEYDEEEGTRLPHAWLEDKVIHVTASGHRAYDGLASVSVSITLGRVAPAPATPPLAALDDVA
jgi:hypothetical protein